MIDNFPENMTHFYCRKTVAKEFNRMGNTETVYLWIVTGWFLVIVVLFVWLVVASVQQPLPLAPVLIKRKPVEEIRYAEPGILDVVNPRVIDCGWKPC